MPNLDLIEAWVCTDCYFAHHYGAHQHERDATPAEESAWLHGHDSRSIMGLEFEETPHGLIVREWFAGESDVRCEGGEPLAHLPEEGGRLTDWTCSNHEWDVDTCQWCHHDGRDGTDGIHDFSWSRCDGCHCTLGGSRYRLAIWPEKEEE